MKRYDLIENTSRVYYNETVWQSNNCGEFKIIAKTNRHRIDKRGYREYKYYLCQFKDDTIVEAKTSEIKLGKVRNPNHPSICSIGYLGEGFWEFYINQKPTREYSIFYGIINRCYNPKGTHYESYGGSGITLDRELHNFQKFCNMLISLPNYNKWKNEEGKWELDKDILCERLNILPKIYSSNTCHFILQEDNMSERNKRVSITGETYVGTNSELQRYEFTNIKEFAREHNLYDSHIGRCIKGKAKTHKGWKFEIKDK